MSPAVVDRIVIEAEAVNAAQRAGVIEEVLDSNEPRYRVRWENGRTSIIVPTSGAARIEEASR